VLQAAPGGELTQVEAAGVVVIALLLLLITRPWLTGAPPTKNTPLGGVSLTQYCSSQNLTINGGYRVQPVDLKAACN
jgi:hypothetical protein